MAGGRAGAAGGSAGPSGLTRALASVVTAAPWPASGSTKVRPRRLPLTRPSPRASLPHVPPRSLPALPRQILSEPQPVNSSPDFEQSKLGSAFTSTDHTPPFFFSLKTGECFGHQSQP